MATAGSVVPPPLLLRERDPAVFAQALKQAWGEGRVVALTTPEQEPVLEEALNLRQGQARRTVTAPEAPSPGKQLVGRAHPLEKTRSEATLPAGMTRTGAGVLLAGGGTSGGRCWCLQPLDNLEASADATRSWLEELGIDAAACLHLNPLPFHHVSGLMPLVRARRWEAAHLRLPAALMRQPDHLPEAFPLSHGRPVLLSLVPTQLARLLGSSAAIAWMRQCAVIWVGGASLPPELARTARHEDISLAPCYGATETAAMVCAQAPERFLAGVEGCGVPMKDVQLRIHSATRALELKTARLSPGRMRNGLLEPLPLTEDGWWRSGDIAHLSPDSLEILGRADGAISSGGETVFPEQLEQRLLTMARAKGLQLQAILLLGRTDPLWGERLAALVRPVEGEDAERLISALRSLTQMWPPAERPIRWMPCPTLATNAVGKWERVRWEHWLDLLERG